MPKKRGQGEGAIYYSETRQRWIGVLDLGRGPDGVRRRVRMSGKTRAEVRRKLEGEQKAAAAGLTADDQRTTVAEFCAYWLQHGIPATVQSPNSIESIHSIVRLHIVPRIGHRRLRELSADDVDKVMRDLATAGYSKSTMVRVHGEIARILRFAERRGKVMRNVATLVDVPAGPKKQGRSLTVAQAKAVLDAAVGDRLEALYVTSLLMGLRPGELLGLPWTAVDFKAERLRVHQSLKREHNKLVVGEPKTLRSRRTLDMPGLVVDALEAHHDRQQAERVEAGPGWSETGLVFTTVVGTPIDPSNLRREFDKLTQRPASVTGTRTNCATPPRRCCPRQESRSNRSPTSSVMRAPVRQPRCTGTWSTHRSVPARRQWMRSSTNRYTEAGRTRGQNRQLAVSAQ